MFDQIVVIDWSANSKPKSGVDSIWIAVHRADGVGTTNVSTRFAAQEHLCSLLDAEPRHRTLIGLDFSFGYPAGTSELIGLTGKPWEAMWSLLAEQITDGERNENNRFAVAAELNARMTGSAVPFWGCPLAETRDCLTTTKPVSLDVPRQWRATEEALQNEGRRPFSCWQLLGAGCVGSQSLLGIPMLHRLAQRYRARFHVWPFTTMLRAPVMKPGLIVAAEIWPSLFQLSPGWNRVRDDLQVEATAAWLSRHNEAGSISSLFYPTVEVDRLDDVVSEEGWVLGVGVDRNPTDQIALSIDVPSSV